MPMFSNTAAIALLLCAGAPTLHAADAQTFDAEHQQARKNLKTPEGAHYDEVLGKFLQTMPGGKDGMNQCVKENPGPPTLHGYFRFDAKGGYQLVVRPEGPFATCFKALFEGRKLPEPPRLPYLNDFNFGSPK